MSRGYDNATDEELIDRLREGESEITDYIIEKYKNLVRKKAKSMFILGADNEDLIQEGMIGLFKAIRDYDAGRDASFLTFADLCVSRQMYTAVQASRREKHAPLNSYVSIYSELTEHSESGEESGELLQLLADKGETNPENILIDQENLEHIQTIISRELSTFEKEVLDLYMTGMSYSQIAKVLGRDEKSTDNALQRLKNKIKKAMNGLLLLFFFLFLFQPVNAKADEEYVSMEIEEAQILMDIPDSCHVLKRTIEEDDPYINQLGTDKQQVEKFFQEAGIVFYGISEDATYELVLTLTQNQNVDFIYNMQSLSDEQIEEFAKTIEKSYLEYGYEVSGNHIYETGQAKYVVITYAQKNDEKEILCEQYYTIRGNRVYSITMKCFDETLWEAYTHEMKRIVDSITYLTSAEMFSYENKHAGVKFELNKGWEQLDTGTEQSGILAQFMHTNGLGESIQILAVDLWGNMDILHQFTKTRAQIDTQHELRAGEWNSYAGYFKGLFPEYRDCIQEKHNGKWYVTSQEPMIITAKNLEGSYLQRSYAMIQNGIIYIFQYGYYDGANIHEKDFEKLIEQVEYEEPQLLYQDEEVYQKIAHIGYLLVIAGVLTVVVIVFVVYLYMAGINRKNEENN